jgi:hypothetical protein
LVLLMAVLIVTCLLLVPAQGMVLAGVEVLVVGVADWVAIVTIHLRQLKYPRTRTGANFHIILRGTPYPVVGLPPADRGKAVISHTLDTPLDPFSG